MKISKNISKKTGRKGIHSDKITNEDLQNIDDGVTTIKEVATKHNIPVQSVHNKQHRVKEKLKLGFTNKSADPNLANNTIDIRQNISTDEAEAGLKTSGTIPIDATEALKGMWQFVDTLLVMMGTLSKGSIEYEKLSDEELQRLATVSNQSPFMRKLATEEGLSALVIVGTIVGTFGSHIKFKFKKKHKKNDANCMCEDCKKLRTLAVKLEDAKNNEKKQIEMKNIVNSNINNVPSSSFDEPIQNEINENTPNNEILRQKALKSDTFNETGEYTLPDE